MQMLTLTALLSACLVCPHDVQGCEQQGMLRSEELQHVTVAASNSEALQQLAQHYNLSVPQELQLDGIAASSTALVGN